MIKVLACALLTRLVKLIQVIAQLVQTVILTTRFQVNVRLAFVIPAIDLIMLLANVKNAQMVHFIIRPL